MSRRTIQQDVPQPGLESLVSDDDIANAFGALDGGDDADGFDAPDEREADDADDRPEITDEADEHSEDDDDEPDDEGADDDDAEDRDETEEGDEDEEDAAEDLPEITDDRTVKVKVGDEEHEVTVAELKRLAGQEKALTQRSQVVSSERKAAQEQHERAQASYQKLLDRVNERLQPYQNLDLVALARNPDITDAQLQAVRAEMKALEDEKSFLEQGLDAHVQEVSKTQQEAQLKKAQENLGQLTDQASPYYVENFAERYNDLKAHAIEQGADKDFIENLIDPWTWRLISDSLRLQTVTKKAEEKRKTKEPKSSARRTKRSRGSNRPNADRSGRRISAVNKLKADPRSEDAAVAAFGALDD